MSFTVSEVSICNQAMVELGAHTFSSFSELTTEAIACNNIFDNLRREILGSHPWNFAMKQVELAENATAPLFTYNHQFTIPSDLLRMWQVIDDGDFRIVGDQLLTDNTTCKIVYVYDNTDVTTWSPQFVTLFVAAIVYKLSYAITASSSQQERSYLIYKEKLQTAKTINASEDVQNTFGQFDSLLLNSRYAD